MLVESVIGNANDLCYCGINIKVFRYLLRKHRNNNFFYYILFINEKTSRIPSSLYSIVWLM